MTAACYGRAMRINRPKNGAACMQPLRPEATHSRARCHATSEAPVRGRGCPRDACRTAYGALLHGVPSRVHYGVGCMHIAHTTARCSGRRLLASSWLALSRMPLAVRFARLSGAD